MEIKLKFCLIKDSDNSPADCDLEITADTGDNMVELEVQNPYRKIVVSKDQLKKALSLL